MLRLLLLRHAKSSWDDGDLDDRLRPLTDRGRQAAEAMAAEMVRHRLLPDYVLCSPARRARETWDRVQPHLHPPPPATIDEALYDFGDGSSLLDAIRQRGGSASNLMVVGHNPAIGALAAKLAAFGDRKLLRKLARKYPTAALSVIRFPGFSWREIKEGSGELQYFIRPRDVLPGAED